MKGKYLFAKLIEIVKRIDNWVCPKKKVVRDEDVYTSLARLFDKGKIYGVNHSEIYLKDDRSDIITLQGKFKLDGQETEFTISERWEGRLDVYPSYAFGTKHVSIFASMFGFQEYSNIVYYDDRDAHKSIGKDVVKMLKKGEIKWN